MKVHQLGDAEHAILALHGFTGSGMDFEALVPHLPVGMLAPDLPGHLGTPPLTMPEAVAALAPLAAGRVVMGYSMGGRTALQIACAVPVRALVLIGATPGIADLAARRARQAADAALARHIEAGGVEAFLAAWMDKPIIASQRRIPSPWRERMTARKHGHSAAGLAGSLRGMGTGAMMSVWDRLPSIPMLLVVGAEDHKFEATARSVAAAVPEAEVAVIPGAGHCAHLEAVEPAAAVIYDFVQQFV